MQTMTHRMKEGGCMRRKQGEKEIQKREEELTVRYEENGVKSIQQILRRRLFLKGPVRSYPSSEEQLFRSVGSL